MNLSRTRLIYKYSGTHLAAFMSKHIRTQVTFTIGMLNSNFPI
jgi:hypothetical protein